MNQLPTARLRHVASLNPRVRTGLTDDAEVSFLPMDAIGENWGLDLSRTRAVGEVKSGYSYFEDGDVAFAKVTPCFENGKGALMQGLAQGAGFGTTELTVLRPNQDVCASFLGYVVKSEPFRAVAIASMTGAGGLKRVSDDAVRDFKTYWPELAEQERIANFLDDKTERIDALIAEKEVLVEALKAYAYSFASKAMTSGLDPKAQLKRTSSPEVGSIPSHWKLERLKFLGAVRSGVAKGKELKGADTVTLPYLGVANVQDGYLDLDDVQDIEIAKADATRYLLQLGDVLMNEGGDNDKLGRGAVWQGQVTPCIHQNHVFAVRLTDPTLSQWVARFTSTDAARAYFFLRSKQSTNLASINQTNVRELPVPMPPVEERKAVLAEVIRATGNAEDLISHTKAHIARLREYRSSLISAAVTGQIDVGAYEMTA